MQWSYSKRMIHILGPSLDWFYWQSYELNRGCWTVTRYSHLIGLWLPTYFSIQTTVLFRCINLLFGFIGAADIWLKESLGWRQIILNQPRQIWFLSEFNPTIASTWMFHNFIYMTFWWYNLRVSFITITTIIIYIWISLAG